MKRVIETLNEMSFILPDGWALTEDVYVLPNGQGMMNKENYLDEKGNVISLFEVHRDPDVFFEGYDKLMHDIDGFDSNFVFVKSTVFKTNGFVFPVYIIKGVAQQQIFTIQVFCNCGDCLACFMVNVDSFDGDLKKAIEKHAALDGLVKILRTIE